MPAFQGLRDRDANIPVIVMSHSILILRQHEAVKLPAREYVVTPFDSQLFRIKCLRTFMNKRDAIGGATPPGGLAPCAARSATGWKSSETAPVPGHSHYGDESAPVQPGKTIP